MSDAYKNETRPSFLRFLDSFLQERNIQWMLAVGMMILLGSTVMLVVTHWDHYTPTWKYLIMLAYTAAIHWVGQWCYYRQALLKTGTVLMALTVLLLPVLFLALHWVGGPAVGSGTPIVGPPGLDSAPTQPALPTASTLPRFGNWALFAFTLVFASAAARRIFSHFLRTSQPTFLASYLILCVAGAIAPSLPDGVAPWASLLLWVVFAAGCMKVNRHVFWLIEQHRRPRVFGFFPIALLATQFLGLFAVNFAMHVPVEWLGFGCLLVAIPVLMTADTVARVFQQRTGDLVRPLPWSVMLPMLTGLLLCGSGICLAGLSLVPPHAPYALVPAAGLAAVIMAIVAHRTGKRAFVWAMLIAVILAYNFSPVFFRRLAEEVVRAGATVVCEERLPYAFYGLTYLPLITGLTAVGTSMDRRGNRLFAGPIRVFGIVLSSLLVLSSLGHVKAMLPVAAAMVIAFGVQTVCYRNPWLAIPSILSGLVAALGIGPFCVGVLGADLPPDTTILSLAAASTALLAPGWLIDRSLRTIACGSQATPGVDWRRISLCQFTSVVVTLALASQWVVWHLSSVAGGPIEWAGAAAAAAISALLFTHGLRWQQPVLGGIAIVFAYTSGVVVAMSLGVRIDVVISFVTLMLLAQWLVSYALDRWDGTRVARTFGTANRVLCRAGLWAALVLWLLFSVMEILCPLLPSATTWWICRVLITVWAFDAARRTSSEAVAVTGCVSLLAAAGAVLVNAMGPDAWRWLLVLWVAIALAALPIVELLWRRVGRVPSAEPVQGYRALARAIDACILALVAPASLVSLVIFTLPMRIAGALALGGLLGIAALRQKPVVRTVSLALVNWQIVALTVLLIGPPELTTLFDLTTENALPICLPVALVAATSLLLWQHVARKPDAPSQEISSAQRFLLGIVITGAITWTLTLDGPTTLELTLALLSFVLLAGGTLALACRDKFAARVWVAEGVIAAAVGYFAWHGVIHLGRGRSMFIVLGVALTAWVLSRLAAKRPATTVLTKPFEQTALALPMATVAIGVYRHYTLANPAWLGMNSLALLLAAVFYFWYGIERRWRWSLVASAAILDIALVLLWRELSWTDPQFYMIPVGVTILLLVRLMKEEIPSEAHDPLNYLGALVILVSPTFHIVTGSWLHLFTLMLLSVGVVIGAIGFRLRVLLYMGTAFLMADLVAMVVRGSVDDPSRLWIAGVALGGAVVALGAVAERNREALLGRLRIVSAALQNWK